MTSEQIQFGIIIIIICITSGGRCALHRQRSPAVSRAASAESPVSCSTYRIHVWRGLPVARLYRCLLSGLRPALVSTAGRGAAWARACSVSRRMWPNTVMRRLRMREMMCSSLVWSITVELVTKWVPSYNKDSSSARHVKCLKSPLVWL